MRIENLRRVEPFTTLDGSEIRELAGLPTGNSTNQSLAEATVPAGGETEEHYHRESEEIYFFTNGRGRLRLDAEESEVVPGDTIVIPPGPPPQALEHGRRAAPAPLLLLARVLARGHGARRVAGPVTAVAFNDGIDGVGLGEFPALCARFFAEPPCTTRHSPLCGPG